MSRQYNQNTRHRWREICRGLINFYNGILSDTSTPTLYLVEPEHAPYNAKRASIEKAA